MKNFAATAFNPSVKVRGGSFTKNVPGFLMAVLISSVPWSFAQSEPTHPIAVYQANESAEVGTAQETVRIETARLIQATIVQIPYGTITWPKGTSVQILAQQDTQVLVAANEQQTWIDKNLLDNLKEETVPVQPKLVPVHPKLVSGHAFVGAPTGKENPTAVNPEFERTVLTLTNNERKARRLKPLELNNDLSRAARYHAQDMAHDKYYKHDTYDRTSNGLRIITTCVKRMKAFAKTTLYSGENIHRGVSTPEKAVADWMKSPGHRENILDPDFTHIGIGYHNGYWVQGFSNGISLPDPS